MKTSQARLLRYLFSREGQIKAYSRRIGIPYQSIVNWMLRGKVPLNKVKEVSIALKVPVYSLNYEDYKKVAVEPLPKWSMLVKELVEDKEVAFNILQGQCPD